MDVNKKVLILVVILGLWFLFGIGIRIAVEFGYLSMIPPYASDLKFDEEEPVNNTGQVVFRLNAAEEFVYNQLSEDDRHIKLNYLYLNESYDIDFPNRTNSEAMSYYLLWNSKARNKEEFDKALDYVIENMLNDEYNYLMWRIEANRSIVGDGSNIASDADLRVIKALYLAESTWGDERYSEIIDTLEEGLEDMAVFDGYFLPYAGIRNGEIWRADEVWISYSNFEVFRDLSFEYGEPWKKVYFNMKQAVLDSQLEIGLFNPVLKNGEFSNSLEEGYSINSLWIMVRAAESNDRDLIKAAEKSLEFYKTKYIENERLTTAYTFEGNEIGGESPWVYALVGRAAINLGERDFSQAMIDELFEIQIKDPESELFGAFPEGNPEYISQFTMQEIILTLSDYVEKINSER